MRRPLFAVCLCLAAIAALQLWLCHSPGSGDPGEGSLAMIAGEKSEFPYIMADGETVMVTGRVCQKNTRTFSLDSIAIDLNSFYTTDSNTKYSNKENLNGIGSDNSGVAGSQQNFSRQNSISEENINMKPGNRKMTDSDNFTQIPGKWICEYGKGHADIKTGSVVAVRGRLRPFWSATNPGEFDTAEYYYTIGFSGKLTDTEVIAYSRKYSYVKEFLYGLKCYFQNRLYKVFPEKEASVLSAMLLGDKAELDADVKELYKKNGIIHILSISGLHITVIGMGVYRLLRKTGLPIFCAALLGGIVLGMYGVMTGMGVSACRAIGMYVIRMFGEIAGRTYDMLTALGVMAVILVWKNPPYLMHAGFLLSFGSILGIGVLYPALSEVWLFWTKNKLLRSLLAGTSITLFTLPILLWFYYEVPAYSILLNFMVLPWVSLVMAAGLFVMLVPGTGIVGTISCFVLQGYEFLCRCFKRLPFHTWNPGKPEVWQVAGYYLVIMSVCVIVWRKKCVECEDISKQGVVHEKWQRGNFTAPGCVNKVIREKSAYGIFTAVLMTAAILLLAVRVRTGSTVTFLDVGQGDCTLVESGSGGVYLFDCGSSSRKEVGQYVLIPYLKYRGINHIDAVFVSHSDEDHSNGIRELLQMSEQEGIAVEQLVLPAIAKEDREEQFAELLEAVRIDSVKFGQKKERFQQVEQMPIVCYIQAGNRFEEEGISFTCLHPPGGYGTENSNAYSECFYIKFDEGASLLLTGDVEGAGEELLCRELEERTIEDVTILKVSHHGSKNSTSEALLGQVTPSVSIISCGRNNRYGHPHEPLLKRLQEYGTQIFQTSESGAVMVRINKKGIQIEEIIACG